MKKYDGLYIFAGNAKDDVLEASLTKAVAAKHNNYKIYMSYQIFNFWKIKF